MTKEEDPVLLHSFIPKKEGWEYTLVLSDFALNEVKGFFALSSLAFIYCVLCPCCKPGEVVDSGSARNNKNRGLSSRSLCACLFSCLRDVFGIDHCCHTVLGIS
jgi:hypothetical protein